MTSSRAFNELKAGALMLIPREPQGTGENVDLLFLEPIHWDSLNVKGMLAIACTSSSWVASTKYWILRCFKQIRY